MRWPFCQNQKDECTKGIHNQRSSSLNLKTKYCSRFSCYLFRDCTFPCKNQLSFVSWNTELQLLFALRLGTGQDNRWMAISGLQDHVPGFARHRSRRALTWSTSSWMPFCAPPHSTTQTRGEAPCGVKSQPAEWWVEGDICSFLLPADIKVSCAWISMS